MVVGPALRFWSPCGFEHREPEAIFALGSDTECGYFTSEQRKSGLAPTAWTHLSVPRLPIAPPSFTFEEQEVCEKTYGITT